MPAVERRELVVTGLVVQQQAGLGVLLRHSQVAGLPGGGPGGMMRLKQQAVVTRPAGPAQQVRRDRTRSG